MVRAGKKMIDVECDGFAHHANPERKKADEYRNAWLYMRGFPMILRFDTIDIKYNINYCTNTIKKTISAYTGQQLQLKKDKRQKISYSTSSWFQMNWKTVVWNSVSLLLSLTIQHNCLTDW